VVDTRDLAHVLDVVGDVRDRRAGLGMVDGVVRDRLVVLLVAEPDAGLPLEALLPASVRLALDREQRDERHHYHATVLRQAREHRVRHVAGRRRQGARVGMREDHRRLRDGERVVHGVLRHMRQVDQHPEPVHLAHDLHAELRQAAVARGVGRRIRPFVAVEMRERHVTDAEPPVRAQRAERVLDRMAALDAEQRGDAARGIRTLDVVGREREDEARRIALDHPSRDVDLLELNAREAARADLGRARDVHRPELAADAAGAQAREIRVAGRARLEIVGGDVARRLALLANHVRKIVVAVDQRMAGEDPARPREGRVFRPRGACGREQCQGEPGRELAGTPNPGRENARDHRCFVPL
jgi:hypothetical protein